MSELILSPGMDPPPTKPGDWWADRYCAGMDPRTFFPEKGATAVWKKALAACQACPVMLECRQWARANRFREGIFGGESARQRFGKIIVRACAWCGKDFEVFNPQGGAGPTHCSEVCRRARLTARKAADDAARHKAKQAS
jgi:WhiB family redox-sensing transcriptional regulator